MFACWRELNAGAQAPANGFSSITDAASSMSASHPHEELHATLPRTSGSVLDKTFFFETQ